MPVTRVLLVSQDRAAIQTGRVDAMMAGGRDHLLVRFARVPPWSRPVLRQVSSFVQAIERMAGADAGFAAGAGIEIDRRRRTARPGAVSPAGSRRGNSGLGREGPPACSCARANRSTAVSCRCSASSSSISVGVSVMRGDLSAVGEDHLQRVEVVPLGELLETTRRPRAAAGTLQHRSKRDGQFSDDTPVNTCRPTAWLAPKPPPTNTWITLTSPVTLVASRPMSPM